MKLLIGSTVWQTFLLFSAISVDYVSAQGSRGSTYCEILWGKIGAADIEPETFNVSWNGFGGTCITNPGFYNITEQDVRDVHGEDTAFVEFNGVRQLTAMSTAESNMNPGELQFFVYGGSIGFRTVQIASVDLTDNSAVTGPFRAQRVARSSLLSWETGSPVYELVAPDCAAIYLMQSMFVGRPGNWGIQGGEAVLPGLVEDGMMTIPDGWTYRTRILEEDIVVRGENGTVVVLNDDLDNSYSKMDEPFDPSLCPGAISEEKFNLPKRGDTYCEILWGKPEPGQALPSFINTDWMGDCPTSPGYYDLSEQDVRDVHGEDVSIIQFNGITQLLSNSNSRGPEVDPEGTNAVEYGTNIFPDGSGFPMTTVATVPLQFPPVTLGDGAFTVTQVNRNTTLSWEAGKPVYELVTPNCESIYVMQDFRIGRPGDWGIANEDELATMVDDGRLTLPEGWTYRTRVLEEDLSIYGDDNGEVTVLLDEFRNHYTKLTEPFDPQLCPDYIGPELPSRNPEGRGRVVCEVLWGAFTRSFPMNLTISINRTEEACLGAFYNLTEDDVLNVHGPSTIVAWNGARQTLMVSEAITPFDGREVYEYGQGLYPDGSGLVMVNNGALTITSADSNLSPYSERPVNRLIRLTWPAGYPVYELIAPNCEAVYVMQSIYLGRPGDWGVREGESALPTLVEDGLITPPDGWTYRTRVLGQNLTVYSDTNGTVMVLQDDVRNSYSRLDDGFDQSICPSEPPRDRGKYGCEILWGHPTPGPIFPLNLTISINRTSEECINGFYNLTDQDVKDVHGEDIFILWNGVRQSVMGGEATTPVEDRIVYEYGKDIYPDGSGFIMHNNGYLVIEGPRTPYTAGPVHRESLLTWPTGYPVYELVSPNCEDIYVMQSIYIGRPGDWGIREGEAALPTLVEDSLISPPEGWIYRTRVLDSDMTVYGEVDGSVMVLQDDARNSYSKLDAGFDRSICPDDSSPVERNGRGRIYCEILWGEPTPPTLNFTISINRTATECVNGFYNLTEQDVKDVHGPSTVVLWNGARQSLVTGVATVPVQDQTFYEYGKDIYPDGSGFLMRSNGVLSVSFGAEPFSPSLVKRDTLLTWPAGFPVYELIDEDCENIYVMQSLFIGRPGDWGPPGGEAVLATIKDGGLINPPQGWTYRTRVLEADMTVYGESDGRVFVLQDDLRNSYSKMDDGFDRSLCPSSVHDPVMNPIFNTTHGSQRGGRYCEILWGAPTPPDIFPFNLTVSWNGTNGECPTNPGYYNVTVDDIKAVHGAQAASVVTYNGVRQWLITSQPTVYDVNIIPVYTYGKDLYPDGSGFTMIGVATRIITETPGPFVPGSVDRPSIFTWEGGKPVYELVAPNCSAIYMMQSFYIGRPDDWGLQEGGEEALETIVETGRMSPPEGWTYRVRMLEEDVVVFGEADGTVLVLSDDMQNTYSKMDGSVPDPTLCPGDAVTASSSSTTSEAPSDSPTSAPTDNSRIGQPASSSGIRNQFVVTSLSVGIGAVAAMALWNLMK